MNLARLQDWMCKAICAAPTKQRGVRGRLNYFLAADSRLSAQKRLDIYVQDYWSRCLGSLQEDFAGVNRLLGQKSFDRWMERYLIRYPSRSFTLRDLGDRLLDFMRVHYSGKFKRIVLDMIRYEWAQIEAFDRPAMESFDPAKISRAGKRNLPRMRLTFQPHLSILKLNYPVYELVDRLKQKSKIRNRRWTKGEYHTIVYRNEGTVYHKEIDKTSYILITAIRNGLSLAGACDRMTTLIRRDDVALWGDRVKLLFESCVRNKWLCMPKGNVIHERNPKLFAESPERSVQNRVVTAASRAAGRRISFFPVRKRKTS